MTRDLDRRLRALETAGRVDRIKYTVSDRPLTDGQWDPTKDRADITEPVGASPVLTETEWTSSYCHADRSRL